MLDKRIKAAVVNGMLDEQPYFILKEDLEMYSSTTKIMVSVPAGDKCTGCDFLVKSYYEDASRMSTETKSCAIFKTKIELDKKCVGCKNCSVYER